MTKTKDLDEATATTVSVLLGNGKSIPEVARFLDADPEQVRSVAKGMKLCPDIPEAKEARKLYTSKDGLSYREIAAHLRGQGYEEIHYLTISTWANNYGWPWGGAEDGEYVPPKSSTRRGRYTLRMSQAQSAEINTSEAINLAAETAMSALRNGETDVVQLAVVKGAAHAEVTDLTGVKNVLMEIHGDEIRETMEDIGDDEE